MRNAGLVLLMLLAGCATPPAAPMRDGAAAPAPIGWADYCRRHPGDMRC
ncbi:hypothetical protein [Sphingomonas oleivorans]|nr:hypothetical protein [Sphingomonas oleivorans]